MFKLTISLAALVLGASRAATLPGSGDAAAPLKEERATIEYTASAGEAVVVFEAESETALDLVEVRSPDGAPVFGLLGRPGREFAVSGFRIEARESEVPVLKSAYAEGTYRMRARTITGEVVWGSAELSHDLLPGPLVAHPAEGARVPATGLVVSWTPDPEASAYRVMLEQGESDLLAATLPAGSHSLAVPDGLLAPGTATQVEIGAVAPNGNCTLVEVFFETL